MMAAAAGRAAGMGIGEARTRVRGRTERMTRLTWLRSFIVKVVVRSGEVEDSEGGGMNVVRRRVR